MLRILFLLLLLISNPAQSQNLSGKLVVFHAGSLSVPFKMVADQFMKLHPRVEILLEAAGSRDCARKIADLKRPCDVFGSADYLVIDNMLIPEHADWNIKFATNEMCIVYHAASRRSNEITAGNWFDILLDSKIAFGRANPNADPCGYRAVLTMQLAEKHYNRPGLTEQLLSHRGCVIRPKETELLALLESNTIDYIFLYRSVAEQHRLRYLILPDQINLKNAALAALYNTVSLELSGKKPGETLTQKGEPMVYGITVPKSAPNPEAAIAFVKFLLTADKGMKLIEELGQPSAIPSECNSFDKLPQELKPFAMPKP
jgi:molybdate/tungstate transport system substrate-binding protein